jgi:hypothetical protein
MAMTCQRCLGAEARFRAFTDLMNIEICAVCAEEARRLGIIVENLPQESCWVSIPELQEQRAKRKEDLEAAQQGVLATPGSSLAHARSQIQPRNLG